MLRVGILAEGVVNLSCSSFPMSTFGFTSSCGGLLCAFLLAFDFPRRLDLRAGTSATGGIGISLRCVLVEIFGPPYSCCGFNMSPSLAAAGQPFLK